MVGWSRRSRESARRRQVWWNSLSSEEQIEARFREKEFDRKLSRLFTIWTIVLVVGGLTTYYVVEAYRWWHQ